MKMVLAYADDDLKLCMRVSGTDDCRLFQQGLDRLQGWCREKKYYLNAGKCKSISFSRGSKPVLFQYVISDSDLDCVDVIVNDLFIPIMTKKSSAASSAIMVETKPIVLN
jgi:hypothetical protein